jgi:hypothetical protein
LNKILKDAPDPSAMKSVTYKGSQPNHDGSHQIDTPLVQTQPELEINGWQDGRECQIEYQQASPNNKETQSNPGMKMLRPAKFVIAIVLNDNSK